MGRLGDAPDLGPADPMTMDPCRLHFSYASIRGLGNGYFVRKRWDYFVKNLLGVEPPHEYPLADSGPR
jgi:hypothetical protein